ncbi:MAG: LysM peptidoglycan-binding domain-containing protein [Albidovulum sp.]
MQDDKKQAAAGYVAYGWVAGAVAGMALIYAVWQFAQPSVPPVPDAGSEPSAAVSPAMSPAVSPAVSPEVAAPAATPEIDEQPAAAEPAQQEVAVAEPTPEPAEPEATPAAPPTPKPPVFDTVRAEADGSVLIAGQAPALSMLNIFVDGTKASKTDVDASGKFAAFLSLGYSDAPRILTLTATLPGGEVLASTQTVILEPAPAPVEVASAEVSAGDANDPVGAADADTTAQAVELAAPKVSEVATDTAPQPVETASNAAQADEPRALIVDADGVRKIAPAAPVSDVIIDTIGYDNVGNVDISGRAGPNVFLRLYLDNGEVANARSAQTGAWHAKLRGIDAGLYTLRVDQIDEAGKVTSRAVIPFQREEPQKVAAAQAASSPAAAAAEPVATDDKTTGGVAIADEPSTEAEGQELAVTAPVAAPVTAAATDPVTAPVTAPVTDPVTAPVTAAAIITVQPGFTLWGIASASYGDGLLYVQVYEANKDQIRDPDLIYPGQVFSVPSENE